MAEESEQLNIKQPEPTDQGEEATPAPSAPPEKKGSSIDITPCLIPRCLSWLTSLFFYS